MKDRLFFAILLLFTTALSLPLMAEEGTAAPASDADALTSKLPTAQTMFDYLMEGGPWLMIPLFLLSFLAILLIEGVTVPFSIGAFHLALPLPVIGAGLGTGVLLGLLGALPPALRCLRTPLPTALRSA